jgi:hypothetical protein
MEGSVDEYWNIFSQHVWNATSQLRNVPQTQARQCSELDRLVPCRYRLRLKLLNVPATLILLCSALVNFINSNPFLQNLLGVWRLWAITQAFDRLRARKRKQAFRRTITDRLSQLRLAISEHQVGRVWQLVRLLACQCRKGKGLWQPPKFRPSLPDWIAQFRCLHILAAAWPTPFGLAHCRLCPPCGMLLPLTGQPDPRKLTLTTWTATLKIGWNVFSLTSSTVPHLGGVFLAIFGLLWLKDRINCTRLCIVSCTWFLVQGGFLRR